MEPVRFGAYQADQSAKARQKNSPARNDGFLADEILSPLGCEKCSCPFACLASPTGRRLQFSLRARRIRRGSRVYFRSPSEFIQQRIIFSFHGIGNDLPEHWRKFESVSAVTGSND